MKRMSLKKFGQIVREVMETLPEAISRHLDNVVVDVEDEPSEELLMQAGFSAEEIADGDSLFGLFVPLPTMPDDFDSLDHPHRILIFKNTLEECYPDPKQLRIEIRKTVIHELAHHFGWSDRDLEQFDSKDDPFA